MPRATTAALMCALTAAACAGELDDPDAFRAARDASTNSATNGPDADTGQDAQPDTATAEDATTDDAAPDASDAAAPDDATDDAAGPDLDPTCAPIGQTATQLMAQRCATAFCHSAQTQSAQLDLESPDLFARLVGVQAPGCPDRQLIDPDDPTGASHLLLKLAPDPGCGAPMPLADTALTSDEIQCIADWISTNAAAR